MGSASGRWPLGITIWDVCCHVGSPPVPHPRGSSRFMCCVSQITDFKSSLQELICIFHNNLQICFINFL